MSGACPTWFQRIPGAWQGHLRVGTNGKATSHSPTGGFICSQATACCPAAELIKAVILDLDATIIGPDEQVRVVVMSTGWRRAGPTGKVRQSQSLLRPRVQGPGSSCTPGRHGGQPDAWWSAKAGLRPVKPAQSEEIPASAAPWPLAWSTPPPSHAKACVALGTEFMGRHFAQGSVKDLDRLPKSLITQQGVSAPDISE